MSVDLGNWSGLVADLVRHRCSKIDAPLTLAATVSPPNGPHNPVTSVLMVIEFLPYEIIGGNRDGEERDNGFACDLGELHKMFPDTRIVLNYTPNSRLGRGEIAITGKICGLDATLLIRLWSDERRIPEYQYNESTGESILLSEEERKLRFENTREMMDDEDDDEDDEDDAPQH